MLTLIDYWIDAQLSFSGHAIFFSSNYLQYYPWYLVFGDVCEDGSSFDKCDKENAFPLAKIFYYITLHELKAQIPISTRDAEILPLEGCLPSTEPETSQAAGSVATVHIICGAIPVMNLLEISHATRQRPQSWQLQLHLSQQQFVRRLVHQIPDLFTLMLYPHYTL